MRVCIDTSAYSHFMRGHAEVAGRLDEAAWVGVPSVALGELFTGFRLGRRRRENERRLGAFLQNPAVEILDLDPTVADIYADLVVGLRRAGTPLPTNDIWIAAVAIRAGATVLTFDRHFARIDRAAVEIFEAH